VKLSRIEELSYSRDMRKVPVISVSLWRLNLLMIKSRSVRSRLNGRIEGWSQFGEFGHHRDELRVF
jgi:hypothetical protein